MILYNYFLKAIVTLGHIHFKYALITCLYLIYNLINLNYLFILYQIKKCRKSECNFCTPIRLPLDVFESLNFIPDPILSQGELIINCFNQKINKLLIINFIFRFNSL